MSLFQNWFPQRLEKVVLKTTVNKEIAAKASEADAYLQKAQGSLGKVDYEQGDTVQYTYNLNIHYFGDVVEMMKAFVALQRAGAVISATTEELHYGYCLCQQLFASIQEIHDAQKK